MINQGLDLERLERISAHLEKQYLSVGKLPGTLTLVARNQELVWVKAQGLMDVERAKPMQRDTLFRIYSMTKPVTAIALMQLYEQGLFLLDDPVHKFIPSFKDLRVYQAGVYPNFLTRPCARAMTIKDLLTHTSGLTYGFMQRTNVDAAYRELGLDMGQDAPLATWVERLSRVPLEFSPGTAWNYSVASDVVGYLVERLSGQTLAEYFAEHIFKPLGMVDTGFSVPEAKRERFASCYQLGAAGVGLQDDGQASAFLQPPTFYSGGGGLISSVDDYYRFAQMLANGGELNGARIIGRKTLDYMRLNHLPDNQDLPALSVGAFSETSYAGSGFGLGFCVKTDITQAQVVSSAGEYGWGGMASTTFWVDPVEDLVVIFMTQLIPSSSYPIRQSLRALVYGALVDQPSLDRVGVGH